MQDWVRRAVIRGDLASVSIAAGLASLGLMLLPALGYSVAWAGLGLLGAIASVGLLQAHLRAYRRLLDEVVLAHAGHDPGPSPVPWVDDAVWREKNRFDPSLDARVVLMAEIDPDVAAFGRDATGGVRDPALRLVTDAERELRAKGAAALGEAPPVGPAEEQLERLRSTPGRLLLLSPRWPLCCGSLATLIAVRQDARPRDALYLPPTPITDLPDPPDARGVHSYRCRRCGRAYATDPVW